MATRKLAIVALGNRNSGKSSTWYELFGRTIRTGVKRLSVADTKMLVHVRNSSFEEYGDEIEKYFEVFVRNASFEEYGDEVDEYFGEHIPEIVFCSVQYKEKGIRTISWFRDHGYYIYIQWLNPGHRDAAEYTDDLNFESTFAPYGQFHKVSGKDRVDRIVAIREFLKNWNSSQK